MSTYAIGDVQGCYDPLQRLLEKINYDKTTDCLWFVGDLINRGPRSLETLRFISRLKDVKVVLGNHDLYFLTVASGVRKPYAGDTLSELLAAPDCMELYEWVRQQPLLYTDPILNFTMVHAGILPSWDLPTAYALAAEVHTVLRSSDPRPFFREMFAEKAWWRDELTGFERLRVIIDCFTRMRFCGPDLQLDLLLKDKITTAPAGNLPWFSVPQRRTAHDRLVFGHWAALQGECDAPNTFAIDTGCVWGNSLTALRLDDLARFSVDGENKP